MKISEKKIIFILEKYKHSRNSDKYLIRKISEYYKINKEEISVTGIIRQRAHIQNDKGLFKPTNKFIYTKRKNASEKSPFKKAKTFLQKLKQNTKKYLTF